MLGPLEDTVLHYPDEQQQAETGFTKIVVEKILLHISLGANLIDAANITMMAPRRIMYWYNENFCNFQFSVDYHRADNKRRYLKTMLEATDPTKVKASQFMLERKYPDEYGKEIRINVDRTVLANISRVIFDKAKLHFQDPEKLKLFIEDISEEFRHIRGSEGMPDGQKLIT